VQGRARQAGGSSRRTGRAGGSTRASVPPTAGALISGLAAEFEAAGLWFGHGTETARDEAAALVFHVMKLDHRRPRAGYATPSTPAQRRRIRQLARRRIAERMPLPYLLGEAWFAGLPFHVDRRVLIPRSPFAELIHHRFRPWINPRRVRRILEIGTGSGCMAVAAARAFPRSTVVATDISGDALAVARRNLRRHGLAGRIRLLEGDLFAGAEGPFDLILSNPPYVPAGDLRRFPEEYRWEPRLALASGRDGMETPARILQHARRYLAPDGWLALEVGEGAGLLERRFPAVPFIWPELAHGGDGIALVPAGGLPAGR
jgi:ribosomal protein L3 glutamine methyltransferase